MNQPAALKPRYFEDFPVGAVFEFGSITVTEPEIIAFARSSIHKRCTPIQRRRRTGPTGGLIASGWHTIALMMRMYVEHILPEDGFPRRAWMRCGGTIRCGQAIRCVMRVTIEYARVSQSKPDRGIIRPFSEVLNQHGEVVLSMRPINLIRRRPA